MENYICGSHLWSEVHFHWKALLWTIKPVCRCFKEATDTEGTTRAPWAIVCCCNSPAYGIQRRINQGISNLWRIVVNQVGRQPSSPQNDHLFWHQTLIKIKGSEAGWDIWAAYLQNEEEAKHEFTVSPFWQAPVWLPDLPANYSWGEKGQGQMLGGLTWKWEKEIHFWCNFCISYTKITIYWACRPPVCPEWIGLARVHS